MWLGLAHYALVASGAEWSGSGRFRGMDEALLKENGAPCEGAIPLSETGLLDPPTAQELTERMEIIASLRQAKRRKSAMKPVMNSLQKRIANAQLAQPLAGELDLTGVKPEAAEFFKALAKVGDVGRAAKAAGMDPKGTTVWRWKKRWPAVYSAALAMGLKVASTNAPLEWEEVEGILASLVRDPRYRDRLKAVELWARLEGRLDTKIQVEVSRTALEAKLQEALTSYGLQTKLISAPTDPSDVSRETLDATSAKQLPERVSATPTE